MVKFLTLHKQQGTQALHDLMVRPLGNMLTMLALAFSLALPATLFMLVKNVMAVTESWQIPNQLTAYLNQDVSGAQAQSLLEVVELWENVKSTSFISPEQGLVQFHQSQGFDEAISLLDDNPLPSVIVVMLVNDDMASATALAAKLRAESEVEEVRLDSEWLQRLSAIEWLMMMLTLVFSGLILMAVFLIIGNTLRLHLFNHKAEIQVLKLVGATDSYILRPYLYTGVWLALAGAVVAWFVTLINGLILNTAVENLAILYNSGFRLLGLRVDETLILLMVAGLIGFLAARLVAGKHLREIEPV
ncbi:permease-like cell division protein FtsX [Candidatus Enterovibrio escicola]|uniref:permease-like cell division protein FtsX n=1 Tax=Candidatus Enterovibrio escicola TaxID=1927127 RepID=UPI0012382DFF|nr:permease-like cell division protein FtsX [Candidatus Enterovibrio escacola]